MRKLGGGARSASGLRLSTAFTALLGAAALATPAAAQNITDVASDEIVVTALKHGERNVQDVPVAITAFGADQLEALNYNDLQSLTYSIPNVQFEDVGTARGVANFSIRGLGINSSIPSVDPTVGVFVDGMYLGINAGVLADNFDLAGIEVLRGPQGVLFGRNVTGGAVVIRTAAPTDVFEVRGGVQVETGLNYTADLAISGPIVPGVLSARYSTYYNQDEGWFENDFDGSQFGEGELQVHRLALRFTPVNNLEFLLRLEQGFGEGDGPAAQNHALYSRDSFDFAINYPGYGSGNWEQAILETNWDVGFGDGVITNIASWRQYEGLSAGDIDATTFTAFHSRAVNEQEQWSNELRYAGTFGPVDITAGHYMFEQELLYIEERFLFGGLLPVDPTFAASPLQYAAADPFWITRVGGGQGEFSTWGAFVNADWHITDQLTLNVGVRYTEEEKDAQVSRIRRGVTVVSQPVVAVQIPPLNGLIGQPILPADSLDGAVVVPGEGVVGGSINNRTLVFSDSPFNLSWNDTSPRIGLQWQPSPSTNLYAFAAKGFRSGGVNFRVTTLGANACAAPNIPAGCVPGGLVQPPTAFDSEEQTSFEVGWKQELMDGRARINLALFHNEIEGMQRETNIPGPSGVQQVIVNAGDAIIQGAELEARFSVTDNFIVQFQAGYTDGEYDSVTADLTGDGLVNAADLALEIPRLAPWTYGVTLMHDLPLSFGTVSSLVAYNHRDENYYTDNNRGVLNEADIIDATVTFRPNDSNWSFAVYGTNLTDEATFGGDTQLPDLSPFGGDGNPANANPTFSPLNKGRVIGARLRFNF
ncbi:MAG: TonB-dependent receptor [Hyphomonadaceae bacterium]|nr:TonB-dependent receptor [Hyphomonadaceae bacterium]